MYFFYFELGFRVKRHKIRCEYQFFVKWIDGLVNSYNCIAFPKLSCIRLLYPISNALLSIVNII